MSSNARYADYQGRVRTRRWLRSQGKPCWICGGAIDYGAGRNDPLAFECDELVPISRGGSPTDRGNVDAAHRCCNNWRRAKPVPEVVAIRSLVLERFGPWSSPLDFVAKAKAVKGKRSPQPSTPPKASKPTTDW